MLGYTDYRNFEQVLEKARVACFNSGQRLEDHFVDITEMIELGKGAQSGPRECNVKCVNGERRKSELLPRNPEPQFRECEWWLYEIVLTPSTT